MTQLRKAKQRIVRGRPAAHGFAQEPAEDGQVARDAETVEGHLTCIFRHQGERFGTIVDRESAAERIRPCTQDNGTLIFAQQGQHPVSPTHRAAAAPALRATATNKTTMAEMNAVSQPPLHLSTSPKPSREHWDYEKEEAKS